MNVRAVERDHLQHCAALDVNDLNPTNIRFDCSQVGGFDWVDAPEDLDSGWVGTAHVS